MFWLSLWLRKLIGASLLLGFVELVLPEGDLQRFARVVMGFLVILVLLQPLAYLGGHDLGIDRILTTTATMDREMPANASSAAAVTEAGLAVLSELRRSEMAAAINSACAAELKTPPTRVEVSIDQETGGVRVMVRIRGRQAVSQVKSFIATRFNLPEDAVEVAADV